MARDEPGDDHSEHAGATDLLGRHVGEERHRERDRRREHGAVELRADVDGDGADDGPEHDGKRDGEHEVADGPPEGERACRCRYGTAQHDEGRRVVDESFALEHGHEARRKPEALANGRRGHRVWWADDCAEGDRGRQVEVGEEREEKEPAAERRDDDEQYGEARDGAQVAPEVGQGHIHGGRVQDGREHDREDQLWRELEVGYARQVPDADAHEDKKDGGCHPEPRGDGGDRDDDENRRDAEDCEFELHGTAN